MCEEEKGEEIPLWAYLLAAMTAAADGPFPFGDAVAAAAMAAAAAQAAHTAHEHFSEGHRQKRPSTKNKHTGAKRKGQRLNEKKRRKPNWKPWNRN